MSAATMSRPLRLSDLMIALAVTAIGLSLIRYDIANPISLTPTFERGTFRFVPGYRSLGIAEYLEMGSLMLAAWSPGVLLVGLRGPAPRWSRLLRQPGLTACAVVSLVSAGFLVWHFADALIGGWPRSEIVASIVGRQATINGVLDLFPWGVFPRLRGRVGPAVAVAWALMALGGRWGHPTGRADWLGLFAGAAWALLYLETLL